MPLKTHRETLDINLYLAKIFGLYGYSTRPLGRYIATVAFRTLNITVTTLVIITNTADFFVNIDNLSEVSYDIGYILPMVATSLKALTMFRRQAAISKIIDDVHSPVTRLINCSDTGVINLIKQSISYQNIDFRMFLFATSCICLTGLLPVRQIMNSRQLMIRAEFPFDEKPYPIFEIVYAVQYYGLAVECAWCIIFDPAVMGLVRWITFQMDVLQSNFQHCDDGKPRATFLTELEKERAPREDKKAKIEAFIPFTDEEANITNDSFLRRFCDCVKNHRRLIDCLDDFNELFGVILFAQIASDCLLTCIGLFQMALAVKRKRNIFRDLTMLGSGLIHLLYWSAYGNLLINEHEKLLKSIYNCGWENHLSHATKPVVVFGLFQGLTPMVMRAGVWKLGPTIGLVEVNKNMLKCKAIVFFFILLTILVSLIITTSKMTSKMTGKMVSKIISVTISKITSKTVIQKAYSYFAILNTMMTD